MTSPACSAPHDSIVDIVELYKRDIDRSLLRRQLARTPEQRLRDLMERQALVEELRRGRIQAQRMR